MRPRTLDRSSCARRGRLLIAVHVLLGFIALTVSACATNHADRSLKAQSLLGKPQQEIIGCAGEPVKTIVRGETTLLIYYEEASEVAGSFMGSKSSLRLERPHACRASLTVVAGRVEGVRYDSIPATFASEDHCDTIFQACN